MYTPPPFCPLRCTSDPMHTHPFSCRCRCRPGRHPAVHARGAVGAAAARLRGDGARRQGRTGQREPAGRWWSGGAAHRRLRLQRRGAHQGQQGDEQEAGERGAGADGALDERLQPGAAAHDQARGAAPGGRLAPANGGDAGQEGARWGVRVPAWPRQLLRALPTHCRSRAPTRLPAPPPCPHPLPAPAAAVFRWTCSARGCPRRGPRASTRWRARSRCCSTRRAS